MLLKPRNIIWIFICLSYLILSYAAKYASHELSKAPVNIEAYRVAVCFFGLNRNLQRTFDSIEQHIFTPLEKNIGAKVDLFVHTYTLRRIDNPRSNENNSLLGGGAEVIDIFGPRLRRMVVTNQTDADMILRKSSQMSSEQQYEHYDVITQNNMLRALYSLHEVTKLLMPDVLSYDAVIFSRMDLKFLDDFNTTQLLSVPTGVLLTPYWQTWGGLNDRFAVAVGSPRTVRIFGNRLRHLREYLKDSRHKLHSETFLHWTMKQQHQRTIEMNMRAQRVRATGSVAEHDRCLELCSPELIELCRRCRWPCIELLRQRQWPTTTKLK